MPLHVFFRALAFAIIGVGVLHAELIQPAGGVPSGKKLMFVLVSSQYHISANYPDPKAFMAGINPLMDACEEALATEKNTQRLLVQVTLRKKGDPEYELAGEPALSKKFATDLLARFKALPKVQPPVCDLCIRFQSSTDGDAAFQAATTYKPAIVLPEAVALDRFNAAGLAQKVKLLREWAREEAVPLLAISATRADPKYSGVINTGRAILALDLGQRLNVEKITYGNPDFWRGTVEMAYGNALIDALPMMLFVANGEIDKANTLLQPLHKFSYEDGLARILLNGLRARMELFNRQLAGEIGKGIELHEKQRYDDAIKIYKRVLADYSGSSSARYEMFFAQSWKAGYKNLLSEKNLSKWAKVAPEIYACNPLFDTQLIGKKGEDLGQLNCRLTLHLLEKETPAKPTLADDMKHIATLAEVALRLERYGEAAQLFWKLAFVKGEIQFLIVGDKEPKTLTPVELVTRFLYCADKLGASECKKNFSEEYSAGLKKLEEELEAYRKQ